MAIGLQVIGDTHSERATGKGYPMSPLKVIVFCSIVFLAALSAFAEGITVRFLPNPPEDSIARYVVLRSGGAEQVARELGGIAAQPGRDTLSFADSGASRGQAYVYSIIGIDGSGARSEPSESTQVALPALDLPDTLRADAGGARWRLPLESDPLSGIAPLALSAVDSARFQLAYDKASRDLVIMPRGNAGSGWVVLRAIYFGKFEDRDSLWLSLTPKTAAISGVPTAAEGFTVPAVWSPARGQLRLRAENGVERLDILDARGIAVAEVSLPGNGSEVLWDGHDRLGHPLIPGCYLWAARGKRGNPLRTGRLHIVR